jgi:two-component system chemotaxis sensor kinase CheA
MVHDLSQKLNKKIDLRLSGEQTEIDKTVMERISDPLVHLVRNAVDHGVEIPEIRRMAGKTDTGMVHLNAYHQGGNIVIEIKDDGAGLPRDKIINKARKQGLLSEDETPDDNKVFELIFMAGFSTAEHVSDVSGLAVGMDGVRKNIKALGGSVEVKSESGKGSTFTIRLPLTLAILDGQLISIGDHVYIVPLVSIVETLQMKKDAINAIAGRAELYRLREEYIPIVRLYDQFGIEPRQMELVGGLLVVVEGEGKRVGLFVDDLLNQQQVVIKSLETNFKRVSGVSGATILGDGTVALILDVTGVIDASRQRQPPSAMENKRTSIRAA